MSKFLVRFYPVYPTLLEKYQEATKETDWPELAKGGTVHRRTSSTLGRSQVYCIVYSGLRTYFLEKYGI